MPAQPGGSAASPAPAARVVGLLCLAEVLSMAGFGAYPALLPALRELWGSTNTEAGLIGGIYFAGYMAAVPVLTSLTDRVDARRVYLFSTFFSALGALGFAILARGVWSAAATQALAGMGLAGTYMPGLKALSDHIEGPRQSRSVAFYTSSFGIGAAFSLWLAHANASTIGWRWAFGLAALGPVAAGLLVILGLAPRRPHPAARPATSLLDYRPVFRNQHAFRYIVGYAAHTWELFGVRSWMVAFLAFSAALQPPGRRLPFSAAALAAGINLLGPPASIFGNEIAVRIGRRRLVPAAMVVSGTLACLVGFAGALPWFALVPLVGVYFLTVMADSASVTAGVIAAARPGERGATMAVYSFLGFAAASVSPIVFGKVLDIAGGDTVVSAWGWAFASMAAGYVLGAIALGLRRSLRW